MLSNTIYIIIRLPFVPLAGVFVSVKPMYTKYLFNLPIVKICFIVILQRKKRREVREKRSKIILPNFFEWAVSAKGQPTHMISTVSLSGVQLNQTLSSSN